MLDGLVRGTVFAQSDGIVREHIDRLHPHEGGQANGRTHVVAEHQERAAVWDDAAVQSHAVHDRAHRMFANAEMEIATGGGRGGVVRRTLHVREVRPREIGAATH